MSSANVAVMMLLSFGMEIKDGSEDAALGYSSFNLKPIFSQLVLLYTGLPIAQVTISRQIGFHEFMSSNN